MSAMPNWIIRNGKSVDFADLAELIGPVAEFAAHWRDIGRGLIDLGKLAEPIHTPPQLIAFVLDNIDDTSVLEVLNEIDSDLAPKLKKVRAKYENSGLGKLLQPIDKLGEAYLPKSDEVIDYNRGTDEGLVDLAIPNKSTSGSANLGKLDLTLGVSGGTALELEAGALWPFKSDDAAPGMLRLGARGELGVEVAGKLPVASWLSIGASAKATATAELGYLYRPRPDELFFETVLPALKGLVSPANLNSLVAAMAFHRLEGVVMLVDGSARGEATVDLGQNLALGSLGLKLGLTGSVHYSRHSKWALSLRKVPAGYDVVLSRLKGSEAGWKGGIGLDVDVSELAQKAKRALDEVTEFTGAKLKQVKPFLSPGTYALEKLDGLLGDAVNQLAKNPELASALMADLGLLLGDTAGEKLAMHKALEQKLIAAIDEVTGGVTKDANDFADAAIENLIARLPEITAGDLAQSGKDEVEKLIAKLTADFSEKLRALVADEESTDALARELASIGKRVKTGADRADDAIKKVRELVAGYENYVAEARDILEKLTKAEIGVQLETSFTKSESAHYEVLGTIVDPTDPATAQLWHQLTLGRLQAIERMLLDPGLAPKGFALSSKSSLTQVAQSVRNKGVTIDVLGDVFKLQLTATGKVEICFEDGAVTVKASAEATRLQYLFGTSRTSSFVSVVELQQFKNGDNKRSIDLSIEYLRKDKDLDNRELTTFLADLSRHNLVSAAQAMQAREYLQKARIEASGALAGTIGFRMELSAQQLNRMLTIGEAANRHVEVERALFILAAQMMIGTHNMNPSGFPAALRALGEFDSFDDQLAAYWQKRKPIRFGKFPRSDRVGDAVSQIVRPLRANLDLFEGLHRIFTSLSTTYTNLPQTPFQSGWDKEAYLDAQQVIADAAKPWIKTRANIIEGKLHPAMLTILHIFAALERGDMPADKHGITSYVDAIAQPLNRSHTPSTLKISMQLQSAQVPVII